MSLEAMRGPRSVSVEPSAADDFELAFQALFLRAMRLAYRMLGNAAAAEDVAADTMVIAYARWERVGPLPYREGWILRVAANLAMKSARARPPEVSHVPTFTFEDDSAIRVALVEALHKLSRRQRDVIVLRFLAGLSEPEVAASLGLSLGTVKTHARRGLAALRARLDDRTEEVGFAHA